MARGQAFAGSGGAKGKITARPTTETLARRGHVLLASSCLAPDFDGNKLKRARFSFAEDDVEFRPRPFGLMEHRGSPRSAKYRG
jgi:hypothetical protein